MKYVTKVSFKNSHGLTLTGILDIPQGSTNFPMVIALHGFGGNKESNQEWTDILNPFGIATLRIDFQGTGESEGKYENKTQSGFLDDAMSAITFACTLPEVDKTKIGVVGHSMGASTAIIVAARDTRVKKLIASVPAVKEAGVIANLIDPDDFADVHIRGYVERWKTGERKRLKYTFFQDAETYDVVKEAQKIPYDFLVVGAKKDTVAPFSQIVTLCNTVPHAKLLELPNSNHDLETDWLLVENAIEKWFEEWKK